MPSTIDAAECSMDHIEAHNFARRPETVSWPVSLLYRMLPAYLADALRFELYMWRVRLRQGQYDRRYSGQSGLLVNVGAGSSGRDGWVNVDAYAGENVNCVYDCRSGLPFDDASVAGIFTEHFFEHLDYTSEALPFLRACLRVLEPGAVLRVVVPDGEKYLNGYCEDGWDTLQEVRDLDGRRDKYFGNEYRCKMELVNTLFRQGYHHKHIYDETNLHQVLEMAGFDRVETMSYGSSLDERLAIDLEARAHESLYVDAVK